MKKFYLISLLITISYLCQSQISITQNDYFNANDSIPRIFYGFEFDTQAVPKDSVWPNDMTFGDYEFPVIITDTMVFHPAQGTQFSDATCWFLNRDGSKMYMKIQADKADLIGAEMEMPFNEDTIFFRFADPLIITPFPANYQTQNIDQGIAMDKRHISVFESIIPPDYYGTISMLYDTVRFFMDLRINGNFDESGNIIFNGKYNQNGNFEYLRENRVFITSLDVQLRSKFNGSYTSLSQIPGISDMLPMQLPVVDTTKSYLYWVKNMKYPILEVEFTNNYDSVKNLNFKYAYLSNIETTSSGYLKIYPNPATDFINFDLENSSNYTFFVIDITGKIIEEKKFFENNNLLNIKDYSEGMYFFKIVDSNTNKNIFDGKFIKK